MKPNIIEEIYAWVSVAEDGDEEVMAVLVGYGWLPLIGADPERMGSLRQSAFEVAERTGCNAYLKKFSVVEIIEEVSPQ